MGKKPGIYDRLLKNLDATKRAEDKRTLKRAVGKLPTDPAADTANYTFEMCMALMATVQELALEVDRLNAEAKKPRR